MVAKVIQPDFWIFHRLENVGPSKAFVLCCITVGFEACIDKASFIFTEKFRFGWPVRDVKVSANGQNDSLHEIVSNLLFEKTQVDLPHLPRCPR